MISFCCFMLSIFITIALLRGIIITVVPEQKKPPRKNGNG